MSRVDRRALGRRLFEAAGHLPDLELAYALRVDARTVREWRGQVSAGKPIRIKRPRTIEMFLEGLG